MTAAAGLPAYEVSNHARPGEECRHNLIYWRAGDWAGVGPGAHGRLTLPGGRIATEAARAPLVWLAGPGDAETPLTRIETAEEYLMMALRLGEGADLARFRSLGGPALPRLADLQSDGLVTLSGDRLTATPAGRLVLNSLIRALLA